MTVLGKSDHPCGWRDNKVNGGILLDLETDEIIASGLSMPYSPRWHSDRLWVLESGKGSLTTVKLSSGLLETVTILLTYCRI